MKTKVFTMRRGLFLLQMAVLAGAYMATSPLLVSAQVVTARADNVEHGAFAVTDEAKLKEEEAAILRVLQYSPQEDIKPVSLSAADAPLGVSDTTQKTKTPTFQLDTARFEKTIEKQSKSLASLREAKRTLESRVLRAESKMSRVTRELEHTRESLLLAETEVERLSHIIEKRNIQSLRKLTGNPALTTKEKYLRDTAPRKPAIMPRPAAPQAAQQLPIATVIVDKANLRTGPGLNNSVLLTVGKKSKLVVEKRLGGWYRVIAPTGERAWIAGEVVQFGPNKASRPNALVRIQGITDDSDQEGFEIATE